MVGANGTSCGAAAEPRRSFRRKRMAQKGLVSFTDAGNSGRGGGGRGGVHYGHGAGQPV